MNTLKLLTRVKIYINTYICQALTRYSSRSYCKSTGRVLLTCITLVFQSSNFSSKALKSIRALMVLALMVSMFSLSAQTPRSDSGADGLSNVTPIGVDYYVPDNFWDQKLTIYSNGMTSEVSMAQFRGKPLILDFWSTSCASCITKFPKLYALQQESHGNFNVLLVNYEGKELIHRMRNDFLRDHKLPTVYGDKYLNALFPHRGVPYYVWITPIGRVAAITSAEFVDDLRIKAFIDYSLKYEMPN